MPVLWISFNSDKKTLLVTNGLKRKCKLFAVIWFALEWSFHESGFFVFRYLSIYPAMNIIYLPLPNCSGNFNRYTRFGQRFARRFPQLPHSTLLSFASLYVCYCIIVFDSIIYLSQDIILNCCFNISDWSPGVTASVPFYQEINYYCMKAASLMSSMSDSRVLFASFNLHINDLLPL